MWPSDVNLLEFKPEKSHLDTLFHRSLAHKSSCLDFWSLAKKFLLLSNGQAAVERGFSINKEALKDNMFERTLVALRVVTDHLMSVGGSATDVATTPELLTSALGAHWEYRCYLDSKKAQQSEQR